MALKATDEIQLKKSVFIRVICELYLKMDLNSLSYKIRGAIFTVHNELGPGLLESVYEAALIFELQSAGLLVRSQIGLPVHYKTVQLDLGFRLDILVEDAVIVEIKSIECFARCA